MTCGWNDNDDQVTIRQDVGGQLVALFSMVDHGTVVYKVELVPVPQHVVGAGLTYEGQGFTLHLNTDAMPTKDGIYSTLSIPSMDIQDEAFRCKL